GFNFRPVPRVYMVEQSAPGDTLYPVDFQYVNASRLTMTFDLVGAPFGSWNVIVVNPDSTMPLSPSTFTIKVPNAIIGNVAPRVLFSGPGAGRVTKLTITGGNFFPNPEPPVVMLSSGRVALRSTQTTIL